MIADLQMIMTPSIQVIEQNIAPKSSFRRSTPFFPALMKMFTGKVELIKKN